MGPDPTDPDFCGKPHPITPGYRCGLPAHADGHHVSNPRYSRDSLDRLEWDEVRPPEAHRHFPGDGCIEGDIRTMKAIGVEGAVTRNTLALADHAPTCGLFVDLMSICTCNAATRVPRFA